MSVEKKRVLVVDDDPDLLKLVRLLLMRSGMEVLTADDAYSARQILTTSSLPDLLILDIMLPDISGIDFLRQMRNERDYDDLPVMILSALIDPEQIRVALDAGADRYLTKPYVASNLVTITQELLRTGRQSVSN